MQKSRVFRVGDLRCSERERVDPDAMIGMLVQRPATVPENVACLELLGGRRVCEVVVKTATEARRVPIVRGSEDRQRRNQSRRAGSPRYPSGLHLCIDSSIVAAARSP